MSVTIGEWKADGRIFVVAEVGPNHNGDFAQAEALVHAAATTGADAVKFQRYAANRLVHRDVPTMAHVQGRHRTQRERMQSLEFDDGQWRRLAALASERGLVFLASAFDEASADALEPLVPAFKVASGDLTHLPLIRHVATKGKPVILSTGMASEDDVAAATALVPSGQLVLMHCVSRYPTPAADAHLLTIPYLAARFGVPVGYSDHTIGTTACLAAAALGAVMLEKHFTLDKGQPLGDHKLSAEPAELADLVSRVREIEELRGAAPRPMSAAELAMRTPMRRALYAARDLRAGDVVRLGDVVVLRPERGLAPAHLEALVGRTLRRDVAAETPFEDTDL